MDSPSIRRCSTCRSLSVEGLLDRAGDPTSAARRRAAWPPPSRAFFRHHNSIAELRGSAELGCELCHLIFRGLSECPVVSRCSHRSGMPAQVSACRQVCSPGVRICISPRAQVGKYLWRSCPTVDRIMVKLEPEKGRGRAHEAYSTVDFLLTNPQGRPTAKIGGYTTGRAEVPTCLNSPAVFSTVTRWIEWCNQEHGSACMPANEDAPLPTRVIDLGTAGGVQDVRVISSQGKRGKYLALSHCWGGPISTTLTTDTLERFSAGISRDQLAANFQHAIDITRSLRVRYLWIDCLCILQDSHADWARESANMANIYEQAYVTISAISSPGSEHGMFARHVDAHRDSQLRAEIAVSSSGQGVVSAQIYRSGDDERLEQLIIDAPLSRRGWTLQESLLSSRIVYFGNSKIYWGCRSEFRCIDEGPFFTDFRGGGCCPMTLRELLKAARQKIPLSSADRDAVLDSYYSLVQRYSSRSVTYDRDKLPALAGIAHRLHSVLGGDYLAGVWSVDFAEGILWTPKSPSVRRTPRNPHRPFRAPSWSWADADWEASFLGKLSPDLRGRSAELRLLSHQIVLKDKAAPHGEVLSAQVMVRSIAVTLDLAAKPAELNPAGRCKPPMWGRACFDEPVRGGGSDKIREDISLAADGDISSRVHLVAEDAESEILPSAQKVYLILMVCKERPLREGVFQGECLILERVNGGDLEDTYRRVGIAYIYWKERADQPKIPWVHVTVSII